MSFKNVVHVSVAILMLTIFTPPAVAQLNKETSWSIFYSQFKACASRAAVDYDKLKFGDFFVYVEALQQVCNTEQINRLVPTSPGDDLQTVGTVAGMVSVCATLGAVRNLQMLSAELETSFGEECAPVLQAVGIANW